MIQRTLFSAVFYGTLTFTCTAQLQRIVVQGNGAPSIHTDLVSALAAAEPGDKLYLSGGMFIAEEPLVFDKPLHIIGAGLHPDSSGVTGTTTVGTTGSSGNHIVITTAASGSSFTGLVFSPSSTGATFVYGTSTDNDDPTELVFQRCEFKRSLSLGFAEGANSSSTFDECLFRDVVSGRASKAVFTRSIFDGATVSLFRPSGLFMRNCVVLGARLQNSANAVVQNCVFTYNNGAPLWQVNGVSISNCIISGASMFSNSSGNSETNNIYGVPPATIFANETDNGYQFSDDLELAPGSAGLSAGNDGRDIGLYGTNSPLKNGAMPYNPHYQQADIAPSTDWNGALPIQVRTSAQTH